MKIRFNGTIEKKTRGCNCKGSKTEIGFVSTKHFILPSGASKTFRAGRTEEVNDEDGAFLLEYRYIENGVAKPTFEEVTDG